MKKTFSAFLLVVFAVLLYSFSTKTTVQISSALAPGAVYGSVIKLPEYEDPAYEVLLKVNTPDLKNTNLSFVVPITMPAGATYYLVCPKLKWIVATPLNKEQFVHVVARGMVSPKDMQAVLAKNGFELASSAAVKQLPDKIQQRLPGVYSTARGSFSIYGDHILKKYNQLNGVPEYKTWNTEDKHYPIMLTDDIFLVKKI